MWVCVCGGGGGGCLCTSTPVIDMFTPVTAVFTPVADTRGTWFKSCLGAVFPAVLLATVNWELVARHKGYMDAANGVSRHLCQWF